MLIVGRVRAHTPRAVGQGSALGVALKREGGEGGGGGGGGAGGGQWGGETTVARVRVEHSRGGAELRQYSMKCSIVLGLMQKRSKCKKETLCLSGAEAAKPSCNVKSQLVFDVPT